MTAIVEGIEGLAERGVVRHLAPGEVLVRQGVLSDSVFHVRSGSLSVAVAGPEGEVEIGSVRPGDLIGEVAALVGLPRSATLAADGDVEVLEVEASAFADWLAEHPRQAEQVAAAARHRLNSVHVAEIAIDVLGEAAAPLVPEVLRVAEWVDVPAGHVLFSEGDAPDAAYFVLSGRLQATTVDRAGKVRVLNDIGRAEVLGELAIIQQSARTATVTALRDSTLARFPIADFERLLVAHPELLLLIVRRIVSRITGAGVRRRTARTVALALVGDIGPDDVAAQVAAAVAGWGDSAVVDSGRVDAQLHRPGIAQSGGADLGDTRVSQYLYELESAHAHVVYVTDPTVTAWSRRVVQRADTVVVVAPAHLAVDERALAQRFVEACTDTRVPRWLALVHPAGARRPLPRGLDHVRASFDEIHHLRRGDDADLQRLARLSLGRGWGLVLGGGGARGFAHLGVVRALRELGVPIDRVGGASMGSIFAALTAMYDDLDEIVALAEAQFDRLLDYTVPVVSLLKAKRITENIARVGGGYDVEDLWIPFYCVSTNLTKSRLEVHRRGDLVTALRASIAIPGVLPPVPFGDDLLVDGGVLDNVPADVMRADPSIATVIAVDVATAMGPSAGADWGMYLSGWQALRRAVAGRSSGAAFPGVGSVLVRTMITGSEGKRSAIRDDGTADLYLDLEMQGVGLLEFRKLRSVMDRGYTIAKPRLEAWLAEGGGRDEGTLR